MAEKFEYVWRERYDGTIEVVYQKLFSHWFSWVVDYEETVYDGTNEEAAKHAVQEHVRKKGGKKIKQEKRLNHLGDVRTEDYPM